METKRRVQWIDAVKGVGIILVIVSHIGPVWESKLFEYLTCGFMPLFFVMSGFTSRPVSGYGTQIRKKAKRLLIPYFVYGLVMLALPSLLRGGTRFWQALVGLAYGRYSLFTGSPVGEYPLLSAFTVLCPLWFLPCMFMGCLWVVAYDNSGMAKKKILVCCAIILTVLSVWKPFLLPWSIDTCGFAFLFMLSGRFAVQVIGVDKNPKDLLYAALLIAVYAGLCELNPHVNFSIGQYGDRGLLSVLLLFLLGVAEPLFLSLLFRFFDKALLTSAFAYIGRHSLRLMCIHLFVSCVVIVLLDINPYAMFLVSMASIFAVDAILGKCFGRLGGRYSLFKYL